MHDDATLDAGEHYNTWRTPALRAGTNLSLSGGVTSRSEPSTDAPRYTHEAFIIRVVNVGRTPVSVFFPHLWFDRHHHWGLDVQPFKFTMNGFYLLNPGEAREWIEPMWQGINQYRAIRRRRSTPILRSRTLPCRSHPYPMYPPLATCASGWDVITKARMNGVTDGSLCVGDIMPSLTSNADYPKRFQDPGCSKESNNR